MYRNSLKNSGERILVEMVKWLISGLLKKNSETITHKYFERKGIAAKKSGI